MASPFWSDRVRDLEPYVPGRQSLTPQTLKLNTNENPYPPADGVLAVLASTDGDALRRYPDSRSRALRAALAEHHGVPAECVFVGNGSDEVLAFAFMAFFDRAAPLERPAVSYGFYPVYARLFGIASRVKPLCDDLSVDLDAFDRDGDAGGLVFANPNSPTGLAHSRAAIEGLLDRYARGVVLVDEAYADFGAESLVGSIQRFPQLLVTQTFSKGRALAGLRIGVAFGDPALIEALDRVRDSFNSYPLDTVAERAAIASLADDAYYRDRCEQIVSTRERTRQVLETRGYHVLPSAANFLFVRPPDGRAADVYAALETREILVRHWPDSDLAAWLRVTVGRDDDMQRLLDNLDELTRDDRTVSGRESAR